MKRVAFALLVALYVVTVGQNWGWFAAALMVAAYVRHHGRLLDPL